MARYSTTSSLCHKCNINPPAFDRKQCNVCLVKQRAVATRRANRLLTLGQCQRCAKPVSSENNRLCPEHLIAKQCRTICAEKQCGRCGSLKPASDFDSSAKTKDGLKSKCIRCVDDLWELRRAKHNYKTEHKEYYVNPQEKALLDTYKRQYGLDIDDYYSLLEFQDGECAICRRKPEPGGRRFSIDHDHITGMVRGILCAGCNSFLGYVKDNQDQIRTFLLYLNEPPAKFLKLEAKCRTSDKQPALN